MQCVTGDGLSCLQVQFVEYQNSLRAVQRNQASAMHAIKSFWAELLSTESTTLTQLSWTLRSLSALEMRAHKLYRIMLERYPANASLMRLYASFLAGVRCAPGRALRMYGKADSLEDAQADAKQGAVVGLGMASKDDAVIMINEVCNFDCPP